ncbi:MAG: phosphotransferase family protein [Saprospiraceae bacterium]|nr:phosphotransferase family protein [Saprospiraceae bacterium]
MKQREDLTSDVSDVEFPVEKLKKYLEISLLRSFDQFKIQRFTGGYSNLTYLLKIDNTEDQWVLRMPPKGAQVKSGHDMSREYKILSNIRSQFKAVPETILFCSDTSVLDAEFYIMKKVDGFILRAGLPENQLPDSHRMKAMFDEFVNQFVRIHQLNYAESGLSDLGNPKNYVSRQIYGWAKRYELSKTEDIPEINQLILWLSSHMPSESGYSLIHNDYKYDNVIFGDDNRILAVLDWEMCTLGDPLMDVGSSLAYWTDPDDPDWFRSLSMSPTTTAGNPNRSEFLNHYAGLSGKDPGNGVFYFAYGLLKLAVIAQQIYKRYTLGHTSDVRFAKLIEAVKACGILSVQAIQRNRIDRLFQA